MDKKIIAIVDDIFFVAKIKETARQISVPIEAICQEGVLREAIATGTVSGIILDLNCNSLDVVKVIRSLKLNPPGKLPPLVGFLRHTQTDLFLQAKEVGLDRVMPRSELVKELPQLLLSLAPERNPTDTAP